MAPEELTLWLARDLDAGFEEVVRTHQHRLFALALGMCGNPHDAEEVAQDTFVRAYRALKRFPPERLAELKLAAWLSRIAVNVVRNRVRSRRPELTLLDGAEAVVEVPERRAGPERTVLARAGVRRLAGLVAALPPAQREAVLMHSVQQLTYAEVAGALNLTEATVRSNVHRGLQALRARAGWLSEVS
ncbi:MAG: RNA polymerase sigma factor [Candidatus Dormibacteraeota bacterium]|nr:RNA polymerase sigma factor [Candidatus Dormibacteraeota bacterium]